MCSSEPRGHLLRDAQRAVDWEHSYLAQMLGQRLPVQSLHGEKPHSRLALAVSAEVVDAADIGMRYGTGKEALQLEPLEDGITAAEMERLERNGDRELFVRRLVHLSHATFAEEAVDQIAPGNA